MAAIQSMTGYGKSCIEIDNYRLIIEIRSVNGKNADISIKSTILPKDKEIAVRQYLVQKLNRGSIEVFINWQQIADGNDSVFDSGKVIGYFNALKDICGKASAEDRQLLVELLPSLLRLPDVTICQKKAEIINDDNWDKVFAAIQEATENLLAFRLREGAVLKADVTAKVGRILELSRQAEAYEKERIDAIREKIISRFEELKLEIDKSRLEQEMIYYIEKLDINEERVRLRQHCSYFLDTLENEEHPGRKLGFIAQEMGREINTTGSKSNMAAMQKIVVKMKDELEKIKEQSLNIL